MTLRIALALTLAAFNTRIRAVPGAWGTADVPSRPVRPAGRHRRPKAYVRAAMATRAAVARAWPIRNARPRGRHRRRRAFPGRG